VSYDPNEPRKSFECDEFSRRPSIDPAPAGFTGLVIGAIVVLGALIAFLMFRTDSDTTTLGMNNSPVTQQAPKTNPEQLNITPESEKKAPPAAEPTPNKDRDPRVDSQNAN